MNNIVLFLCILTYLVLPYILTNIFIYRDKYRVIITRHERMKRVRYEQKMVRNTL